MTYIAYLRVSTQKQGFSGLGLEAQREIITKYLGADKPIAEYVEVESGKKANRPKLMEALKHCKKSGATLIVAKLDRLSRNLNFLSKMLESDTEIVFCDFPQANKMVLHILGAIAQYEAELISARTKAALKAKKERGFKLGNPHHLMDKHVEAVSKASHTNRNKAKLNVNNKRAVAILKTMNLEDLTYSEIAETLNNEGFSTSKGFNHTPKSVERLIKRYKLKKEEQQ